MLSYFTSYVGFVLLLSHFNLHERTVFKYSFNNNSTKLHARSWRCTHFYSYFTDFRTIGALSLRKRSDTL